MEITLKNIQYYPRLSEETNAFNADVFYRGVKVASASNDGHGGCTNVRCDNPNHKVAYNEAEAYCATLPDWDLGDHVVIAMNLEHAVDRLLDEYINQKEEAKFKAKFLKDMEKGILTGEPTRYHITYWKGLTISQMLKSEKGVEALKNAVSKLQSKKEVILNTNLKGVI